MTKPREVELWPCDYSAALLVTVERHCRLLLQGWRDQRSERSGLRDFMCCDSVQSDSDFPSGNYTCPLAGVLHCRNCNSAIKADVGRVRNRKNSLD